MKSCRQISVMIVSASLSSVPESPHLSTGLTVVWLLASVGSLVHSQGRSLDESFAATLEITEVRFITAVDALYLS